MKNLLSGFLVSLVVISCATTRTASDSKILQKTEGSITFVVDENLPAPESHLKYPAKPEFTLSRFLEGSTQTDMKGRMAACSFQENTFY